MSDDRRSGGELMRRAQQVAMGLADTGLTQAEEMLRRVSPEGRAQAKRERMARARRRNRLIGQGVLLSLIATLVVFVGAMLGTGGPVLPLLVAGVTLLVFGAIVLRGSIAGTPRTEALPLADLPRLPAQASDWLAAQRKALPAPAARLADGLSFRLDELRPQLARLAPEAPAAEAVRKLVATELPALVEGWKGVPPSLRGQPGPDGRSPDAQLVDGLKLIDGEVARMTEQLARGALDEVATQGRYLELKYRGE